MSKLTPWFIGSVKPHRVGVYEREPTLGTYPYSHWTGKHWGVSCPTAKEAAHTVWRDEPSGRQDLAWRGLTTKDGK